MADGSMPTGWGFIHGRTFGEDDYEVGAIGRLGLPDMPKAGAPARQRAKVIAWLVRHPLVVQRLRGIDIANRYGLPLNRACELLNYARRGHVPAPQGLKKAYHGG